MPKLRIVSGKEIISLLSKHHFSILRQKGSHVRLIHVPSKIEVTVPLHREIDRGTLRSILRTIEPCLTQKELQGVFYTP